MDERFCFDEGDGAQAKRAAAIQRLRADADPCGDGSRWKDFKCALCHHKIPVAFNIDHIVPLWDGGTNDRSNLQGVCVTCHGAKTGAEARARTEHKQRKQRSVMYKLATRLLFLMRRFVGVRKRAARSRRGS